MMKVKCLLVGLCFCTIALAQTTTHTIQKGETISMVAKKYGIGIKDVLELNGLTDHSILRIGQIIKIPAKGKAAHKAPEPVKQNTPKPEAKKEVIQKAEIKTEARTAGAGQHLIVRGESLGKIARKYNVTEKQLMEWNNLKNDNIRAGDYLNITAPGIVATKNPEPVKEDAVVKKETPKTQPNKKEEKTEPIKNDNEISPKKDVYAEKPRPVLEVKEDKKIIDDNPVLKDNDNNNKAGDKGAFEGQYNSSNNSIEGSCGIFKTIAGWHDKKYYILINNVDNGSVVKVMANNKFVYAKVLGALPDIKDTKNYKMRVSNATAAALGIQNNEFTARVEF